MSCRHVEPLISRYLDGRLSAPDANAVMGHLDHCPACRHRRDEFAEDGAALRSLAALLPPLDIERLAVQQWKAERARARGAAWWLLSRYFSWQSDGFFGNSPVRPLTVWRLTTGVCCVILLSALGIAGLRRHQPGRRQQIPLVSIISSHERLADNRVEQVPKAPLPVRHPVIDSDVLRPSPIVSRPAVAPPGRAPANRLARRHRPDAGTRWVRSITDDLRSLNGDPAREASPWMPLPRDDSQQTEAQLRRQVTVRDDFVMIPFPRIASNAEHQVAAAAESYKREAAIVDPRLAHQVTCAFKATALSDVCDQLRSETGIQLSAGPSVADEKVTLFCEKLPLREVMRQLSRPFGYAWLRSGKPGEYRYELAQDLKSQLLEEELRNRDRNAALLAMEQEAERFRPYLELSPDEALARAATAAPEEKKLLEYFAGKGWGPAKLYFRLAPADQAALRAGQTVTFSASPSSGEQPLPPELARSVIASLRDYHIVKRGDRYDAGPVKYVPDGLAPAAVPEAQPVVSLKLIRSELGQISLQGLSGFFIGTPPDNVQIQLMGDGERNLATGISPAVRSPRNAVANAALARDPDLQPRLSVRPQPSRNIALAVSPVAGGEGDEVRGPRVTTADVLEALHRATGLSIVSDYYTKLFRPEDLLVQNQSRFEALNRLADTMRMRWRKEAGTRGVGGWVQFRSTSFFNDRLKEVPNRLLNRWAAARRRNGALTLEEMVEIARLSDAQLDSDTMAEGARLLFGLVEWRLARDGFLRPNWRYLAGFSAEQRRATESAAGLPFRQMPLAQQQRFLALALGSASGGLDLLEDLAGAALRVEYVPPVGFQLQGSQTSTLFDHGLDAPRIWGQTREAALQVARRMDPNVTAAQIIPAELGVTFTYRLGGPNARLTPMIVHADSHNVIARRPQPVPANR